MLANFRKNNVHKLLNVRTSLANFIQTKITFLIMFQLVRVPKYHIANRVPSYKGDFER